MLLAVGAGVGDVVGGIHSGGRVSSVTSWQTPEYEASGSVLQQFAMSSMVMLAFRQAKVALHAYDTDPMSARKQA